MGNTIRLIWRNKGWKSGKECQGKFKKMVGSLGGSEEKVKMEHFDTLVGIGKQRIVVDGTGALIYLVKLMKTPSILRLILIWLR